MSQWREGERERRRARDGEAEKRGESTEWERAFLSLGLADVCREKRKIKRGVQAAQNGNWPVGGLHFLAPLFFHSFFLLFFFLLFFSLPPLFPSFFASVCVPRRRQVRAQGQGQAHVLLSLGCACEQCAQAQLWDAGRYKTTTQARDDSPDPLLAWSDGPLCAHWRARCPGDVLGGASMS